MDNRAQADQVRTLFDTKAGGWPGKYAAGGRLTGRLARLAGAAGGLVAAGGDVLDLGCGSGELARHLAKAGYRVTGCDIAPMMLRRAALADPVQAVRWIRLEPAWSTLPFAAGSLDAVLISSVLEYVPEPTAVLAECARVLRPRGVLLCTVPSLAHPVRWLEWPLGLAARTPLAPAGPGLPPRAAQYLAYLRTSRHRRPVRWWQAAARQAGLEPAADPPQESREPLRLLAFTRPGGAVGPGAGMTAPRFGPTGRQQ